MTDIEIRSWETSNTVTSSDSIPDEKWILLEYDVPEITGRHIHAIPVSGLAFRAEILGTFDYNYVFDVMIKEMNSDTITHTESIYPPIVEKYYTASTDVAKDLLETYQSSPSLRSSNDLRGDFLQNVRSLLRGGEQTFASMSGTPSLSALVKSRSDSSSHMEDIFQSVNVLQTNAESEVRSHISGLGEWIESVADALAHEAMKSGAYYYANMLRR